MAPSFQRQWIKRCVDVLTRSWTRSPRKHRRETWRPSVEQLEIRCTPTAVPPGTYGGTLTGNTEFLSTSGTYFINNLTVPNGVTLTIGTGVAVQINSAQSINVDQGGTLSFGAATLSVDEGSNFATESITVNGSLSANGTSFLRFNNSNNGSNTSQILVNAGGRFTSTNSRYDWDNVILNNGSVPLATGDVTGNIFGVTVTSATPASTTLAVPATDVPLLTNNQSFEDVSINAGILANGQSVALNVMGTVTATNLRYVFPGNAGINQGTFEVASGATLSVGNGASVLLRSAQSINVDAGGVLSFGATTVSVDEGSNFATESITVNGSLSANGTSFLRFNNSNNGSNTSQILVNASGSSGRLTSINSNFNWDNLTLNSGSSDTIQSSTFTTQFNINSGASVNISGNDFTNIGANGVVASGDPNATINLTSNYWGTTNSSQIAAKILDHVDDTTRPTVAFNPFLNAPAGTLTGAAFNDVNGNGVQDSGEPNLAGLLVYLDLNNNGTRDTGEPSAVTDPTGSYTFTGLAPATYVVRESTPAGSVETAPSASGVATTIFFDGTGGEAGITGAGISHFTYQGASFSGGTIFAPSSSALYASGTLAYNASSGSAEVDFSLPVSSVSFFYVHGSGFAASTATAFGADGSVLGTVGSKLATTNDDPNNFVTLGGFAQPIARITFSGAVIDNFTFTTAANNQAFLVRVLSGQTATAPSFGITAGVNSGNLPITENFDDGIAHFFSPQSSNWSVSGGRYGVIPSAPNGDGVSTLQINGSLPANLEFDVTMNAVAGTGSFFSNGFIIFDYQSPTNFKFAGAFVGNQQWVVGHRDTNGWEIDAMFSDSGIAPGIDYNLKLLLQGNSASLLVNGVSKVSHTYSAAFSGSVGLGTLNSLTQFDNLTVKPS